MQDFIDKKILIGVCGGIAAYKTAYLIRDLTRAGAQVRVVMTESAKQFINPLTFQALSGHEVRSERFDTQAERAMGHIELARWADYLVIAPATANTLAKMAHGIADDLLTTLYLVIEKPVIVCPAMNKSMWAHPATQENARLLAKRKVIFAGPQEGEQACGEEGYGRMAEPQHIINIVRVAELNRCLDGKTVLITAGPTQEAIDPVRYLSNHSSGKMGYALAQAAAIAGARVSLISGPTNLSPPPGVNVTAVESAHQMHEAVMAQLKKGTIFIAAAAVADYHCGKPEKNKMKKKGDQVLSLELALNPDILADVARTGKAALTVGFAAETNNVLDYARKKLSQKKIDWIVANEVGKGKAFHQEDNQVTVISQSKQIDLEADHKQRLAGKIIAIIAASLQNECSIEPKE